MNTSQPNFNEELEIKINAEEYLQKLNGLNIFISVFSFVDENNSILIGKCEINPAKMFPFLNEQNECEDFFHIIGEEGQVMGQLDLKFKFDKESIDQRFKYSLNNTGHNNNMNNNDNYLINKKNNNTISYPMNNVFEKNNSKKNFMKTGGEGDLLHKRLQEAMNSIDDLTQILKEKVENEKNNNLNDNDNFNEEEMAENYNEEEMFENYEEQIENEENNFEENNENIIDNGNNINNLNNDLNNDLNNNNNENDNKTALTDFNHLNNSQKMSENGEENEKASFYSEKNEKDKKMKYLKNYDKNLLNKIQKIMKNKK